MRLERNSLIAITLLLMAGCSANRLARQADSASDSSDQVPLPLRHADEYDSDIEDHEYHPFPSSGDGSGPIRTPVPPHDPMQEPVPAPPAIGVSRVKSVSWLPGGGRKSESSNCGVEACGDGRSTGQRTNLPPAYFTDGCGTTPKTTAAEPSRCRKKRKTLADVVQGWNLRAKTHRPKRVQTPYNCGEGTACEPGFILPEGCNSRVKDRKSYQQSRPAVKRSVGGVAVDPGTASLGNHGGNHGGSLADPLQENGWDDHGGSRDQRFSPDELLDLPSSLETPIKEQSRQDVSIPEFAPGLPIPESATELLQTPAIQTPDAPAAVPQQINRDSVKRIVQPPVWPRLGSAAATSGNAPAATPAVTADASLPTIQPGRRI